MYSQNQEEKYILEFFGKKVGNLLEIGANDGITYSNTRALIRNNWFADLVEPSPNAFKKLKILYDNNDRVSLFNAAITNEVGEIEFYESGPLVSHFDSALVSTAKKEEVKRWFKVNFETIKVKSITIAELLEDTPFLGWGFISIDAEGYDLEILRQIDLTHTKLLCIEWNSNHETKKAILDYTSKFQMNKILYTSGENLLICRS